MNKTTITRCPVCGNPVFSTRFTCRDYSISKENFEILCCNYCGFSFTQGFPSEDFIDRYYLSKDYVSHSNTSEGTINAMYHAVRNWMLKRKAKLITTFTQGKGRLLDIGCGTGHFLNEMKKQEWKVCGIEKNTRARNFAEEKFNLIVYKEEALFDKSIGKFDVVTLWHVLEHLEPLNEVMESLHDFLDDDGRLFVALPNCNSYDAEHYKETWAAYDVPRHLWHFTPDTFIKLAQKHQFEVIAQKIMPFDSFYVSILSEKYNKSKFPFLKGLFFGLISLIISSFAWEKGSSIIYVLKKKDDE